MSVDCITIHKTFTLFALTYYHAKVHVWFVTNDIFLLNVVVNERHYFIIFSAHNRLKEIELSNRATTKHDNALLFALLNLFVAVPIEYGFKAAQFILGFYII